MPWKNFVESLCFPSLFLFLNTCTFDMEIPECSLSIQSKQKGDCRSDPKP